MAIFYLDYENGDDVNDGSDWANAWKTITNGATAARIAPGDIIRIAKSPAPTSIGNVTWTNLSKTVTLASAQNLTIDLCETIWTGAGDTTITLLATTSDGKEGSYCMKLTVDSSPSASILQAFFATGELDLSSYQKISFWIKNSGVISEDDWIVNLCSDVAGETVVDSFLVPAIPSTARWVPLILTKVGGGNLGASIQSIAIYSGSGIPLASKYIYVDDFIACKTAGLNLQSLISKNTLEQGGTEGWYGIQSINGVTVLLDNDTNTKAGVGRGYSGATETVDTYIRETTKTDLAVYGTTLVQEVVDSGILGSNIEFQGGYDTTSGNQTGETFFDGLNGNGVGLKLASKSYITLNYLNFSRYDYGVYLNDSHNNTITTINNLNNNDDGIYFVSSHNNTITTINNVNNNDGRGIYFLTSNNNTIITITNANNNNYNGVYLNVSNNNTITTIINVNNNDAGVYLYVSNNNTITTITNANNNNGNYGSGINFERSSNNTITTITTSSNATSGIILTLGRNYIINAVIGEAIKVTGFTAYANDKVFINNIGGYSNIWTDYGNIVSQDATAGGTGLEWKLSPTNVGRNVYYPLALSIAKIAVLADKLVTVKAYFKKSHATDIGAQLVCRGGQIAGVATDVTATAPSDTARNEVTITFTPTEVGVVEIEAWAYWLANLADENVIIDDMTITQAD